MRILGLVFAGTSTERRSQMVSFVSGTLALPRAGTFIFAPQTMSSTNSWNAKAPLRSPHCPTLPRPGK
jgi:hypothetical protein